MWTTRHFIIVAYVVMPDHVHLLVSEPRSGLLSAAIQGLKIRVAKALPEKPFWQRRYYDFNVVSERKWAEKIHYIHWNPVKPQTGAHAHGLALVERTFL